MEPENKHHQVLAYYRIFICQSYLVLQAYQYFIRSHRVIIFEALIRIV
jgi:hypothetical protein